MATELKAKYYGDVVERYNERRANSGKWKTEHRIVTRMLAPFAGKSVLDLPCGTGRFMQLYKENNCKLLAVDVSTDMVDYARKEAETAGLTDARFQAADVLTMNPSEFEADVVVSIRFMNWLSSADAARALTNLVACARQAVIVGIRSVNLDNVTPEQRTRVTRRLNSTQRQRPDGKPHNFLHLTDDVLQWFKHEQVTVKDSELVEKTEIGADYVIYYLTR